MADRFRSLEMLRSLGDFDDPMGPAVRLQVETLLEEMRRDAVSNPTATYRLSEEGPELTVSEILAQFEAEDRMIAVIKQAFAGRSGA